MPGLLDRCQHEEITGITLYETINEVTHRLMVAEAISEGVITLGGARALRKNFRLIPDLEDSKIVQAGNASIEGASIALLSKAKRHELEGLAKRVEHCRLETHPSFFDYFVEGCQFKPLKPM